MAAVGLNVLVNFLLVNSDKLYNTFNYWNFTSEIVPNYLIFAIFKRSVSNFYIGRLVPSFVLYIQPNKRRNKHGNFRERKPRDY